MNSSPETWDSCVEAGRQAYEKGCYAEADQILARTMERFSSNAYQRDMVFVDLLMVYARVKRERNEFADALSLYYRALSILQMKAKRERVMIARILQEIAVCHCLSGRFFHAREKEKRALRILDEIYGVESQTVDDCIIRLACLSWVLEDMDSASVYLEKHLRHAVKQRNLEGQAMVAPTSMLAQVHYRIGNYLESEQLFEQAREFFQEKKKLAKEFSIIGNQLGMSICAQGRCEEARRLCRESAEIRSECYDRGEKLDKSEVINDIADFYCMMGDFKSAQKLCESAESLRWDAPEGSMADKLLLYSRLLTRLGHSEEIERLSRRVRELKQIAS
ncbi:MAG: tetratricopeptide repeat protein [Candidatus Obscuribacterales bacterium]|nr:tetratricopeptide repeat protein [Candidatus Obscuribacterales bacterium]HNB21849.1 tetratricopeptide repeat protein [Candidatus Melainabacteria bacterium]